MPVHLRKPELAKYVDDQVRAGHFPDAEAVVEDALLRVMEAGELAQEDSEAIARADAQIDRGECEDFDVFAARMRKKYGIEQ